MGRTAECLSRNEEQDVSFLGHDSRFILCTPVAFRLLQYR